MATLLARPFRPLFTCASIYAVLVMGGWLAIFYGVVSAPQGFAPTLWHAHEMVFGYALAVVAGFLLTAVENWTGLDTARGRLLGGVVAMWLIARVTPWTTVPNWVAGIAELGFLITVTLIVGQRIHAAGQRRNLVVVVILVLLTAAHASFYQALFMGSQAAMDWLAVGLRLIIFLMVLIAGRVMPLFTRNAIAGHQPVIYPKFETASLMLLGVWVILESLPGTAGWLRCLVGAGLAAALALRCWGWFARGVVANPMLWVLYAAFGWIIVGLGLTALAAVAALPASLATHAFTVGGIGVMTAGMMARVTLGHTGRPIRAGPTLAVCFALLNVAALVRVAAPVIVPQGFVAAITLSSLAWMLGFVLLAWNVVPLALMPRADGRLG